MTLTVGDYALLWLYKGYNILFASNQKLDQQYIRLFQVIEKIGLLAYWLDILKKEQIYPVFSITQFELYLLFNSNLFLQLCFYNPDLVYRKEDIDLDKSFEVKQFINKRQSKHWEPKYLIR